MNIGGQGLSLSLNFSILFVFSLEIAEPIKAKFHLNPSWDEGTKICSNSRRHMTSMATMPIYGKNP